MLHIFFFEFQTITYINYKNKYINLEFKWTIK
jgi:hypothetical protein